MLEFVATKSSSWLLTFTTYVPTSFTSVSAKLILAVISLNVIKSGRATSLPELSTIEAVYVFLYAQGA